LSLFVLLFVIIFFVSACSDDADSDTESATDDEADAQAAEDGEETLIFGRGSDSITLDAAIPTDGESIYVTNQIYDTLVRYEEESTEVKPALATDWEVSDDDLEWTFQLRDDVTFHDGNEFSAEDVVYNFERWTTSSEFFYYGYMFGASEDNMKGIIDKVEATDEYEVTITLSEPNAPFLQTLAMPMFGIASPEAVEKYGDEYFKNPVGTGPFIFEEWIPDDSITVVKNDDYFGEPANVDKVVFRVIPDNGARFMELQSGSIDIMMGLNPQDIETAEESDDLQIIRRPSM